MICVKDPWHREGIELFNISTNESISTESPRNPRAPEIPDFWQSQAGRCRVCHEGKESKARLRYLLPAERILQPIPNHFRDDQGEGAARLAQGKDHKARLEQSKQREISLLELWTFEIS